MLKQIVTVRLGVAFILVFGFLTISGLETTEAIEWWKPLLHRDGEWNCCDGSHGGGEFKFEDGKFKIESNDDYESEHEANPDNNQKIEINQNCEHVNNCIIDLAKLNDQKASSDEEYTDKSDNEYTDKSDNEYTSKDEYKGEYDSGHDHGDGIYDGAHPYQTGYGGHNHDAFGNGLSQKELDYIHKNGLKVEITLVAQKNPKLYDNVEISAGDGSNSYYPVTATFPFGDALRTSNIDEVTYEYYYAPGVISVGEDFNICVKNLNTGQKTCETGINHSEHQPEEVTIKVPV